MIVAGTLTNKMAPALRKVYDQMPGESRSPFILLPAFASFSLLPPSSIFHLPSLLLLLLLPVISTDE